MYYSQICKAFRLSVVFLSLIATSVAIVSAQPVYSRPAPTPAPKTPTLQTYPPLVRPTPLVKIISDVQPALTQPVVAGYRGILVETPNGQIIDENMSNTAMNPASNVKLITAFAVLKTLGPNYRFPTNVWTDGTVDATTGTLNGNLYISGRDPSFNLEHAVAIAEAMNRLGIRTVNGDLIVTANFTMNFNPSTPRSTDTLFATLSSGRRSSAATKAWQTYLFASNQTNKLQTNPGVDFVGKDYVDIMPTNVHLLFTHESIPVREILKATLCYSNNFMAEHLGDAVGGTQAVMNVSYNNAGVLPAEMQLASSSGLGMNRVTPRAMMKVLKSLKTVLAGFNLKPSDIMCVAGVDDGTLRGRFTTFPYRGSVVAKTGTLGQTDAGVSSLAGYMKTATGEELLFVIFNQKGSVNRFRDYQNDYVTSVLDKRGGAAAFTYTPQAMATRMAGSRITFPATRPRT